MNFTQSIKPCIREVIPQLDSNIFRTEKRGFTRSLMNLQSSRMNLKFEEKTHEGPQACQDLRCQLLRRLKMPFPHLEFRHGKSCFRSTMSTLFQLFGLFDPFVFCGRHLSSEHSKQIAGNDPFYRCYFLPVFPAAFPHSIFFVEKHLASVLYSTGYVTLLSAAFSVTNFCWVVRFFLSRMKFLTLCWAAFFTVDF